MTQTAKYGALIPSAGYSSRMGEFKPLLEIGGRTVIERQIDLFQQIGIASPVIVTGYRAEELFPAAEKLGARVAVNKDFDKGMFSSVRAGLPLLQADDIKAFFMLPVDIPLVPPIVLERMCRGFDESRPSILYAAAGGRRGHPPLVSAELIPEILAYSGDGGLRRLLDCHEPEAADFESGFEEVLLDMDSPDAYKEIARRWSLNQIPPVEDCLRLLEDYRTPPAVVEHSVKAAELSSFIVSRLNANGLSLSAELAERAGLLHDIAKGRPGHAAEGERILRLHGLEAAAEITGRHMNLYYKSGDDITETEILYLADKLLDGTLIKPLEIRKQEALRIKGTSREIREAIERRFDEAAMIAAAVEDVIGQPLIREIEMSGCF